MDQVQSNQITGAQALVRMLRAHDVEVIFGLCGDTSLPFYDALFQFGGNIRHILTRDERHAAYMADAYARLTGKVGVCEGPSGGGATYILPGVVEANESSIPILALTTDLATTSAGRYQLTELDQKTLFSPLTKWNDVISDATRLPALVRKAFREMTTGRPGAVHLALPFDVQKASVPESEIWAEPNMGKFPSYPTAPRHSEVTLLASWLQEAERPLIICGGGPLIALASQEVAQLAEILSIPIATSVSGQGIIAGDHPLSLGVVGSNGGVEQTSAVVENADRILFIGCRAGSVTTQKWRFPSSDQSIAHIDSDPAVIGANYRTDVGLVGDAKLTLMALLEELNVRARSEKQGRAYEVVAASKREKFSAFDKLARSDERPIRPERVIATLNRILDEEAIICADPGTPCPYFSAFYKWPKTGRHFITNRAHGALGFSLAAAIGAQVGKPSSKVVAVMGDGSFNFCCGEYETITRLNLPITSIVFSNSVFGWIKAGQDSGFGRRFHNVDFNQTDHAAVAAAFGVKSWRVENPGDLEMVLKKAITHEGPTLVDIISQPLHEANAPVTEWVA